jgi:hypothetical protein
MHNLWRGSLLPLECEALASNFMSTGFWAASQPSGSKLPRHNGCVNHA